MEKPRNASKVTELLSGAAGFVPQSPLHSEACLFPPYWALYVVVGSCMHSNSEQCECTPRIVQFPQQQGGHSIGELNVVLGRAQALET